MSESKRAMMPGPNGTDVSCRRYGVGNLDTGDYCPEYGARVLAPAVFDDTSNRWLLPLDDGRDIELTRRAKAWANRDYTGRGPLAAASTAYREAVAAREAMRESDMPVPTSVPGAAGSNVSMYQLDRETFDTHVPAPVWSDYARNAMAAAS